LSGDGDEVDANEIKRDRARLTNLLNRQEPVEDTVAGMSFNDSPVRSPTRPPPASRPSIFRFHSSTVSWSDDSDAGPLPPVPEPPNPWSPQSPTLSAASGQTFSSAHTWNSNSSASASQISHWAIRVFDGRHGSTYFQTVGEPTACFGRTESTGCLARLAAENFLEVLRLPLDAARFYVKIFWRPSDHRARILMSHKDPSNITIHYSIPLTALKLVRKGPSLHLFRYDRENDDFMLWACLNFTVYEQMVLFYCAFAAMKSQDWTKFPDVLQDRFHKRIHSEEKEEFSGEIKDDNYLHALRIYVDKDSGGMRLEARARRGPFTQTPIWTAFISRHIYERGWITWIGKKVVQLGGLHPYVFCHGYVPPKGKNGQFRLQFTSAKDATAFADMVHELARS